LVQFLQTTIMNIIYCRLDYLTITNVWLPSLMRLSQRTYIMIGYFLAKDVQVEHKQTQGYLKLLKFHNRWQTPSSEQIDKEL
jgi:hypothetical protein